MASQFDNPCWSRVAQHLNQNHLQNVPGAPGRSIRATNSGDTRILGRRHVGHADAPEFWFNIESRHLTNLQGAAHGYIALACGSGAAPDILLLPINILLPHITTLSSQQKLGYLQHNLRILFHANAYTLAVPGGQRIELTQFRI